jgi:hypothetical protein
VEHEAHAEVGCRREVGARGIGHQLEDH